MKLLQLTTFLDKMDSTPRLYFHNRLNYREDISQNFLTKTNSMYLLVQQNMTAPVDVSPFVAIELNSGDFKDCGHVVRNDITDPRLVIKYTAKYLTSSLLLNIMFNPSFTTKSKLDQITYVWYYYFFMSDKDLVNITHNVCFQLEEMIKQIITKELGIYRNFNTADAVAALRLRLASERLVNMGSTSKGINFRR